MATTAIKDFRTEVAIEVPGCPSPLIDREVLRAAIDFCDCTFAWQTEAKAVDIQTAPDYFDYALPQESRLVTLGLLPPGCRTIIGALNRCIADWHYTTGDTSIAIHLEPNIGNLEGLRFMFALKPTQDALTVPSNLYRDNLEAIGCGAKARLLAMPQKDWSNPQLAAFYVSKFDAAKRKTKAEVLNSYARMSTLTIRPHNYYG